MPISSTARRLNSAVSSSVRPSCKNLILRVTPSRGIFRGADAAFIQAIEEMIERSAGDQPAFPMVEVGRLGLFDERGEFFELAAPCQVDQAEQALGSESIEKAMIEDHSKARSTPAKANQKKPQMMGFGFERSVDVIVQQPLCGVDVFLGQFHNPQRDWRRFRFARHFPIGREIKPICARPGHEPRESGWKCGPARLENFRERSPSRSRIACEISAEADAFAGAVVEGAQDPVHSRQIAAIAGVGEGPTQAFRLAKITAAKLGTVLVSSGFSPAFMRLTPNFCSITSRSDTKRSESIPREGRWVCVVTLPGLRDMIVWISLQSWIWISSESEF